MRLVLYVALSYAFALVKGINQFKDPRHPFTTISTNTPNYTVRWTCEDCAQQPIDLKVYYTKFSDGWQEVHLLGMRIKNLLALYIPEIKLKLT
jgi:hypothetical protein